MGLTILCPQPRLLRHLFESSKGFLGVTLRLKHEPETFQLKSLKKLILLHRNFGLPGTGKHMWTLTNFDPKY